MSKSVILEEESQWAQTFVTVTPQENGFLREIVDTSVVSGNDDVPLNLDTWNIVLRRSFVDKTKGDFTDSGKMEKFERVDNECQTFLRGVPKVDLPLVYRDEATQTLYIGKDEPGMHRDFDDIITVMNEKPLPEWKKSQIVQTTMTIEYETLFDGVTKELKTDVTESDDEKSDRIGELTKKENATMESLDLVNFFIDRAIWMSEPVSLQKRVTKDAQVETLVKYNHVTKKLMIDHDAQTCLSCEPKYSNSMLLSKYNETKTMTSERRAERHTERRFEEIGHEINYYPSERDKRIATIRQDDFRTTFESRRTKDILLADNPSYVRRNHEAAIVYPCSESESRSSRSALGSSSLVARKIHRPSNSSNSSFDLSYTERTTPIEQHLPPRDEEALKVLKNTFLPKKKFSRRSSSSANLDSSRDTLSWRKKSNEQAFYVDEVGIDED